MEESANYLQKINKVIEKDPTYSLEAYTFVLAALHDTVAKLEKPRHVTGQELAWGMRRYALDQFGPMAKTVLQHWGIRQTLDLGKIVFALIEIKLLSKQDEDKLEDFDKVYEFEKSFSEYTISDE